MAERSRKAFVCGHPIAHSRSPQIHGHWLREYGIAGSYDAIDIAPAGLPAFLDKVRAGEFAGGNVTIPHKEAVFRLVDEADGVATEIGAVNTVWAEGGKLHGSNTDCYGFATNLDQRAAGWDDGRVAAVVGAGGAARAVIHALKQRGFAEIRVLNRTVDRAHALTVDFGSTVSAHRLDERHVLGDADVVVNTSAAGLDGVGDLPVDVGAIGPNALVTDIVYVPLETPLLVAARARGLRTADGLGMLLHQAVPGFERWFGCRPDVTDELRGMIIATLGAH